MSRELREIETREVFTMTGQPAKQQPRSPKRIYLKTAKPEDFIDIQIQDWIEGLGMVSCHYEANLVKNYGRLICSRLPERDTSTSGNTDLEKHWRDLFISDVRGSLVWDAKHGNPELFKAVRSLDSFYDKFTVEQHDAAIAAKAVEEYRKQIEPLCDSCPHLDLLDHCPLESLMSTTNLEKKNMNAATKFFMVASNKIPIEYFQEQEHRRNLSFDQCTELQFFEEYIYAILNLGMREQTMRPIYDKFMASLDINDIKTRFPNKQRAAATEALNHCARWFEELKCAPDKVEYLGTLPLIGKTTKWHLAQNIGIDCVKPDLHLIRLSNQFGFDTPLSMCECIRSDIGDAEKLSVIDLILWRYCNIYGSTTNPGDKEER